MSVHSYRLTTPATVEEFIAMVAQAVQTGGRLDEVVAEPLADELTRHRTLPPPRHFTLQIQTICPTRDDFFVVAQDTQTSRWQAVRVDGPTVILQEVS